MLRNRSCEKYLSFFHYYPAFHHLLFQQFHPLLSRSFSISYATSPRSLPGFFRLLHESIGSDFLFSFSTLSPPLVHFCSVQFLLLALYLRSAILRGSPLVVVFNMFRSSISCTALLPLIADCVAAIDRCSKSRLGAASAI